MNEIKLKQIIEETIREYVGQLIEYAHPRKLFIERAEGLFTQIVIHDCLIRYNSNNEENNINIPHWKQEILSWVNSLINIQIKSNDDTTSRYKALMSAIDNIGVLNDIEQIQKICFLKAKRENIDVRTTLFIEIAKQCQEDIKCFIQFIAEKNILKCDDFLNKI